MKTEAQLANLVAEPESISRDPLFVTSVAKGLQVMKAFYGASGSLSLSEIAKITGMGKSTAQRFCHTLVELGYLDRDPDTRRLTPSLRLLDLSYTYFANNPLSTIAAPFLLQAREDCGEAINLAMPLDLDVIYVARLPSLRAKVASPVIGARAPIYCTASGRACLSTLPDEAAAEIIEGSEIAALTSHTLIDESEILGRIRQARRDGYSIAVEECLHGEISVAAPIIGRSSRSVGAVNICVTRPGWDETRVRNELAPLACRTAHEISQSLV